MGLMNWHWDTYHFCCPKAPSSDLYFWGVTSMPSVQARLVELSKDFGLKTDDESGNSSAGDESSNSFSVYWSSSPKVVVDVESFGAIGDNATLCTASINAAISHVAAAPGGGTVRLSRGSYLSGRVELASRVELWIAPGSAIQGSADMRDWSPYWLLGCGNATLVHTVGGPLLWAANQSNFAVRGGGTIRGPGPAFWNCNETQRPGCGNHGYLVSFSHCTDVVFENLTITMAPGHVVVPLYSERLLFQSLRIVNPADSPYTDAFDPTGCSDVIFRDSYVSTGDDCVAVKSGERVHLRKHNGVWHRGPGTDCRPAANILIENIECANAHGLTIGSSTSGGVRNVTFRHIHVQHSSSPVCIRTCRNRGGVIRDILYENMSASSRGG
jgi:polygalacturonase